MRPPFTTAPSWPSAATAPSTTSSTARTLPKSISDSYPPAAATTSRAARAFRSILIKALKCVLYGRRTPIDYIDVSGVRCLNVAGTGLDVAVLERVYAGKSKSYLSSLVYNLKHFTPYRLTVTADGITNVYDAIMVGACNGTQIAAAYASRPPPLPTTANSTPSS